MNTIFTKHTNNAQGKLSVSIDSGSQMTFSISSGGDKFPAIGSGNEFRGVIWSKSYTSPDLDAGAEYFTAYRTATNAFTFTLRGAEGSTAGIWQVGDNIALVITSGKFQELEDAINTTEDSLDLKATQFVGICAETPITADDLVFDYVNRTLTIVPPLGHFHFFTDGNGVINKFEKVGNIVFPAWTDTNGVWYFHFDNNGNPVTTQTPWTSFDTIATVYRLVWNNTLTGNAKSAVESFECHLNTISSSDHAWKHRYGAVWNSGLVAIHNRILTGTPNIDGRNTCISLTTGSILDDNLLYTISNNTSGLKFSQDMGNVNAGSLTNANGGIFRVRTQDAGGLLDSLVGTRFPFAFNASTNIPQYITTNGTRTDVPNGYFFVYFLYGIQDPRSGETIKSISATAAFTTIDNARASSWTDVQAAFPLISDNEIRPLYKLIYEYKNIFDVAIKFSALRQVDDLRKTEITQISAAGGSVQGTSVIINPTGGITETNAQAALAGLDTRKEDISNKENSTLDNSTTKYPTNNLIKTYVDNVVAGLLDYRGAYNASGNTFPTTGGSGTAGAVVKGDMWIISVAGVLGTQAVQIGDSVIASVDSPGQTASNWNILNSNISYVPEDIANKVTSISAASTDTQYASAKLLYDLLLLKQATLVSGTNIKTVGGTSILGSGDIPISSGSSFWTVLAGATRVSNTSLTVTGDQTSIIKEKSIVKWTESSTIRCAMVSSVSYSTTTTINLVGDVMASIDSNSFKYCAVEPEIINFAYAGNLGATATDVMNAYYADEPFRVLGAKFSVGTAGTTNSSTIDINKAGTTMFTTKPTLATTVASAGFFTADTATSLAVNDKVTIDIDAVQTTNAIDGYVRLYLFPTKFLSLT